ncbi:FAD/NAD(P)-binding domain-containing protein [Cryphonectria parasitica EP155]|uniref:FAD/NAD(P)-binding domain-containing protein n=1 Tax=Cryphonectria parasitica (strain ATCC 38755 / EP155) TaxID=660469 RepID=A0A9P4XUC0_CRYP1|nr:FAD/NAD(P)-binding domain-containing protein [Cryphonectria parasitica EP155]KAF3760976.1 FAD/NAD(P)-binding domain-containing protein [Cryphonectria parasitica EP155]
MASKVYDVLIIGGGPAGLTVATTIARQLQTAIVLDSGAYRNARTEHMHGVPGFDHVDPAVFRTKAKGDILARYDTVEFKRAWVAKIEKLQSGRFQATDGLGNVYEGRKIALATGVKDVMLDIEGYDECWGWGIFHCLFCHGFEERGGDSAGLLAMGMLAKSTMATHVGNMALQFAKKLTVYTNGDEEVAKEIQANAKIADSETRVNFEKRRIKSLKLISRDTSDVLVTLEDGTEIKESFITHYPDAELNGPFASQLGLTLGESGQIDVHPPFNETSLHGVFAAGDAASTGRVVPIAIYGGSLAAGGLVAQLLAEKAEGK